MDELNDGVANLVITPQAESRANLGFQAKN